MSERWERLLDKKPVALLEALATEAATLLCDELRTWPLPVQEVDTATLGAHAALLVADAPRPSPGLYLCAFTLVRWELARETDALDEFMRNQRYLERGVAPTERPALLFVTRWLLEQLLALADATEGRARRTDLLRCVDHLEALWQGLRGREQES